MTRTTSFSESFWDKDFLGTEGFDILVRRLKDGRAMCKDLEDFLKSRVKLEEEYYKGLNKLVKNAATNHEIGTLRDSWQTMINETQNVGKEHLHTYDAINEQIQRISKFHDKIKNTAKQTEDTVRRAMQKKKDLYRKTMEAKKGYEHKCREADQLENQIKEMKQNLQGTNFSPKEIEKLSVKQVKTRQEADRADKAYKQSVDSLDQTRIQWENEMQRACETFQAVEEERVEFLRNEMWINCNIFSQTSIDDDKHQENIRASLEHCNIDSDIGTFINERRTGSDRPGAIPYENFYRDINSKSSTLPNMAQGGWSATSTANQAATMQMSGNRLQYQLPPHPRAPDRSSVKEMDDNPLYQSIS